MQKLIHGTFHFHTLYSHDGRSTLAQIVSVLRRRGFSFCIMTEHFEDFDAPKFNRYLQEVQTLNQAGGFVLVPGVEISLSGIHTIVFPVKEFDVCARFASERKESGPPMFKVVAHPSKYRFEKVSSHLETYGINAVELWNQQEDGSYMPPFKFLESLRTQAWRDKYHFFFGCDLHDANLTVSNRISLPEPPLLSAEAIAAQVIQGHFITSNLKTGVEYRNGPGKTGFDEWLEQVLKKSYYRGRFLRAIRQTMKGSYRLLPRHTQHWLNDFKNLVRNKV